MRVRPGSTVLVKPNLVSHKAQLASTHAAAFGATLKALFEVGAGEIIAAEGATDAPSGFTRFGLRREAEGRAVRFFDLNREESRWEPLELTGLDGTVRVARVSKTVTDSECRVSLAMAKTHVTSILTLSLKNMLSSIHPSDRVICAAGQDPAQIVLRIEPVQSFRVFLARLDKKPKHFCNLPETNK